MPQKHRRTQASVLFVLSQPHNQPLPMQPRPRGFVSLSLLPPFGDCGLVRGKAQWGQEGCCDAPLSPPYFILFYLFVETGFPLRGGLPGISERSREYEGVYRARLGPPSPIRQGWAAGRTSRDNRFNPEGRAPEAEVPGIVGPPPSPLL